MCVDRQALLRRPSQLAPWAPPSGCPSPSERSIRSPLSRPSSPRCLTLLTATDKWTAARRDERSSIPALRKRKIDLHTLAPTAQTKPSSRWPRPPSHADSCGTGHRGSVAPDPAKVSSTEHVISQGRSDLASEDALTGRGGSLRVRRPRGRRTLRAPRGGACSEYSAGVLVHRFRRRRTSTAGRPWRARVRLWRRCRWPGGDPRGRAHL